MGCCCCSLLRRTSPAFGRPSFPEAERVAYVSDVEGHWDYFCDYVGLSQGLRFCRDGDHHKARCSEDLELELEDGWHFVFGGDAGDKGPGTLRFLCAMVGLKQKYPDRVHLLLGNRDINKLRWTSELAQSEIDRVREVPGAYWVPEAYRVSPWQYLRRLAAREEGLEEADVTDAMVEQRNTKVNRMRFMLASDMGSDGDFEFRRQELAHLGGVEPDAVTDEDVVQSYEESLQPGGVMREYLRLGQLAVVLGESLFVHGQIVGNNFAPGKVRGADERGLAWSVGVVPDEEDPVESVREWLERLNAWGRRQIAEWERSPTWRRPPKASTYEDWRGRGASELVCYGSPAPRVPTVVYCRFLTDKCMPLQYPPDLVEYLRRNGIRNVIVGHTPHGNAPTVIQNDGVTVIMGDTSYSDMKSNLRYAGDNRGKAVSDIVIKRGQCSIQGCTEKREFFDYVVAPGGGADPYVGKMQSGEHLDKKFFVKARLSNGSDSPNPAYLMSHIEGFGYEYAILDQEQVRGALAGEPVDSSGSSQERPGRPRWPASTASAPVPPPAQRQEEQVPADEKPARRAQTWPRVAAAAAAAGAAGRDVEELPPPPVDTDPVVHCQV